MARLGRSDATRRWGYIPMVAHIEEDGRVEAANATFTPANDPHTTTHLHIETNTPHLKATLN